MAYAQYVETIRSLLRADVEFVIVGMAADGSMVRVLDLPTLIEVKRRAGRAKDLAVMPVLEATLVEIRKQATI